MRIGVFSDSYRPYTSGVVTSICTFKKEMAVMGHETFIFAPNYPNYKDDEKNVFRFFSLPAPSNHDFSVPLPAWHRVLRVAKKLDLDIIHVHSPFIMGQIGARCSRKLNIPLVFTYHTLYDQYLHYVPMGEVLARDLVQKYSSYFGNLCDLVIAPSSEILTMIQGFGVTSPIEVIPTGVDVDKFRSGNPDWLRQEFNIPAATKICLFVGRLNKEKNLGFLIEAFNRVRQQHEAVCLVIVASGPQEKELKRLVVNLGMNLGREVIFTGMLPPERVVDAYRGGDIFTFASVTETQGIVLVEAMAAGLPVVAVRGSGTDDMVQHGRQGMLVEQDIDLFADQVLEMLRDDQQRNKLSEQAIDRAYELSAMAMASKLEQQYLHVMEEKHSQDLIMRSS